MKFADDGIGSAPAPLRVILYEGDGALPIGPGVRFELMRALLEKGYRVTHTAPEGAVSAPDGGALLVLARWPGGAPPRAEDAAGQATLFFREVDGLTPEAAVELAESIGEQASTTKPGGWKPWFPVIDYDRCTNCMQCLSFCLFDVYGVKDKKIQVLNQVNCKNECPACSRVCPEVAIVFPKYRSGPINGDEINPEDLRREAMKVDISALLGGDIYAMLRDRSDKAKSRFSKERDDDRALKERQRCLVKLQEQLDIPQEVLAALPSMEQIQAKAARMMAPPPPDGAAEKEKAG